jgi:GPN-loop GTPase
MEPTATVFVTGTAGAGKTTLVGAFQTWLRSAGYDATVVNLDPGTESPEDAFDVDIREWVRLADVMDEYHLGPNGAQVAAADLIALKIFDVKAAVAELQADYVLVDTPGQVELFAFRESSKAIVEALGGERGLLAFLFDPALVKGAAGFVSVLLLSATVEFRLRLPTLNLLTKSDLLEPAVVEQIVAWGAEPDRLKTAVEAELPTPDVRLTEGVLRSLEEMAPMSALLPCSSRDRTGLEAVYRHLQAVYGGGADLEASHAPAEEPE